MSYRFIDLIKNQILAKKIPKFGLNSTFFLNAAKF